MPKNIIKLIAAIEVAIGLITVFGVIISTLSGASHKPLNVFIFVLLSSMASTTIGIGLFKHKHWSRMILVFFSGYIIFTKFLIFTNLMHFNGEIITFIPTDYKNYISILYHAAVMVILTRANVVQIFNE